MKSFMQYQDFLIEKRGVAKAGFDYEKKALETPRTAFLHPPEPNTTKNKKRCGGLD